MATAKRIKKSVGKFAKAYAKKNLVKPKKVAATDFAAAHPAPVDVTPTAETIAEMAASPSPDTIDRSERDVRDYERLPQHSASPRVLAHEQMHREVALGLLHATGQGLPPRVDPFRGVAASADNLHAAAAAVLAANVNGRK